MDHMKKLPLDQNVSNNLQFTCIIKICEDTTN